MAILTTAILEVVGVASILPFMQLIATPEAIDTNPLLQRAYNLFGFANHRSMLVASGILVVSVLILSNFFAIFVYWRQLKYTWFVAHNMCMRLLSTYLKKPYTFFLNKNTTELRAYLISEVNALTTGVIAPFIELLSRFTVALIIFTFLLFVDYQIALVAFFVLGGAYVLIYLLRQRYIRTLGERRLSASIGRYRYLGELLSGIKTVKSYNAQPYFYRRYEQESAVFSDIAPKFNITTMAPRYILEVIAFGGILLITLYIFIVFGSINDALPVLSLYAAAGYKLLPALQKAFSAITKVKHNLPILEKLYDDLFLSIQNLNTVPNATYHPIPFQQALVAENVYFKYEDMTADLFSDFNMTIEKGQTVAFVGATGSGKTTLVDLIVGLLRPQSGNIKIDETKLSEATAAAWYEQIAYVPQEVFLFDSTIVDNIVFGHNGGKVDQQRLKTAMEMADIADFVLTELPAGIQTTIGEDGVRLSGGQRQRIGLARALYRNPSVLILDEATSALDNITEKSVIDALETLPNDLTVILIAHRLSTVRYADCVYMLEKGRIIAKGSYQELLETSDSFREMALLT